MSLRYDKNGKVTDILWEEQDLQWIRDNIPTMSLYDMAIHFGVSYQTVRLKVMDMGLRSRYIRGKEFTREQDEYIKTHYPTECDSDIAFRLGISPPTVRKRASELGLRKEYDHTMVRFANRYVKDYKNNTHKVHVYD
jgi:hypothetical protein